MPSGLTWRLSTTWWSSGNAEIIDGCTIKRCFNKVFASKFIYDERGEAVSPGVAINYTTKTQYLFRINKDVLNHWDNDSVNRWQPLDERPLPFTRMIFIGDGDTDIPSMKMVRFQGRLFNRRLRPTAVASAGAAATTKALQVNLRRSS